MAAREPRNVTGCGLRAAVVMGHDSLLGDVHDPRGDCQIFTRTADREALAVVALVHLVKRGDRLSRQLQPRPERSADLAASPAQGRSLRGNLLGEAGGQLSRSLRSGPRRQARRLRGERLGILQVERLELALHRHVVIEHLRKRRRVGRAAERAQQRCEVRRARVRAIELERVRDRRGDDAGPQSLLKWDAGTEVCRQRQCPEQLRKTDHILQVAADPNRHRARKSLALEGGTLHRHEAMLDAWRTAPARLATPSFR